MKKVLCVKDLNSRHDGGLMAKAGKLYEVDDYATFKSEKGTNVHICIWPDYLKEVETFEHDGEEWIKHDAGFCPVPDDWVVCVMIGNKTGQNVASKYYWGKRGAPTIDAYRVISTAKEKPAPKAEAQEEESFEKTQYDENKEMIEVDFRERSPQELAFAAKHPEPEKPKPLAFPDVKLNDNFSCHVGGKWG